MKIKWDWIAPFFPALLAVVIVTALDALRIIRFRFSHEDLDTIIIFLGLILTIVIASVLLSREAVRQMRLVSLRQAQEEYATERSRFLRRLDHELKNPLTGIRLAVNNIAEADDRETRQRLKANIHTELTRLNRIVIDLRKIADLSTQKLELSSVNLRDLLEEVFAQAREENPTNERDLQLRLPEPTQTLPNVLGDQDLLLVAVYNLLNNALKYTRPGGMVTLSALVQGETVMVEVCDTGIGIAAAELPFIWDELYRSERVRDIPGSGIGLALVKLIVERHGGMIDVQSQIDQGTTMRVYLPVIPAVESVTKRMQPVSNP